MLDFLSIILKNSFSSFFSGKEALRRCNKTKLDFHSFTSISTLKTVNHCLNNAFPYVAIIADAHNLWTETSEYELKEKNNKL